MGARKKTFEEQFFTKIEPDPNSGCWLWTGAVDPGGYSVLQYNRRTCSGHRVGYEKLKGPIPDGLQLDHKCRTRSCVNPDHLEPVTPRENIRRSPIHVGAATHCPAGHAYDAENTGIVRTTGERFCRACRIAHQRTPEARAKQAAYRAANRDRLIIYLREYRRKNGR